MLAIIGKSGQLANGIVDYCAQNKVPALAFGREDIDLFDLDKLLTVFKEHHVSSVINACAYTAVDKAESDEKAAYDLNELAVQNLAKTCKSLQAHLVHVSTDYVFAGDKGSPYLPDDEIDPQGVYGASKAAGESELLQTYADNSCILRTSWVYSKYGNNFVKTMLRLMKEKPALNVIDDQVGSPTSVDTLARVCVMASQSKLQGIHHISDEGIASWYDFAVAIQEIGIEHGLLSQPIPIGAIPTSAYPTPAKRPLYSVMSKQSLKDSLEGLVLPHWRVALTQVIKQLS